MPESGISWVSRFPASKLVDDLEGAFRVRVVSFLKVLTDARARVDITATLRPPQRAYLMHYSWCIARQAADPAAVPAYQPHPGGTAAVDIQWLHRDATGQADIPASRKAAHEMVEGYGILHLGVSAGAELPSHPRTGS
jgi:hypothetical protein